MDKTYNNLLAPGCSTNDSENIKDNPNYLTNMFIKRECW